MCAPVRLSEAPQRLAQNRTLLIVLILNLLWTASLFLVPFTLPPGEAAGLDGNANLVDNYGHYTSYPPYQQAIYVLGDFQCHQMGARSMWFNGNQMPIDARMTSMYVFASFGILTAIFARPTPWLSEGVTGVLPRRLRVPLRARLGNVWTAVLLLGLAVVPVAIDGFYQLLTPYESTNLTRVLTGIPSGWAGGLFLGMMFVSLQQFEKQRQEALRSALAEVPRRVETQ